MADARPSFSYPSLPHGKPRQKGESEQEMSPDGAAQKGESKSQVQQTDKAMTSFASWNGESKAIQRIPNPFRFVSKSWVWGQSSVG